MTPGSQSIHTVGGTMRKTFRRAAITIAASALLLVPTVPAMASTEVSCHENGGWCQTAVIAANPDNVCLDFEAVPGWWGSMSYGIIDTVSLRTVASGTLQPWSADRDITIHGVYAHYYGYVYNASSGAGAGISIGNDCT